MYLKGSILLYLYMYIMHTPIYILCVYNIYDTLLFTGTTSTQIKLDGFQRELCVILWMMRRHPIALWENVWLVYVYDSTV